MESTEFNIDRPERVSQAIKLFYLTIGIGIVRGILETARLAKTAPIGFILFIAMLTFAIMIGLIYMAGKGRNWARNILLVLFLIGFPFSIMPLLQSLASNLFSGLLGIAQAALQAIALIFLFRKDSSEWFRKTKMKVSNSITIT